LTESELGFPTNVLDDVGLFFQPQLQMSTDFGRIAVCPGAFDESSSGMGIASFGHGILTSSFASRGFRRDQAQKFHQFPWIIKAREIANVGDHGDGDGEWHATAGLKRLDHRVQTPRLNLLLEGLFETLEAFGVLGNRSDVFLKNGLLGWCGADDFREPTQVGRVPIGSACVTDILPQQEGFESKLGGLEIADGVFTSPGELSDGFIFHFGDIDHSELP